MSLTIDLQQMDLVVVGKKHSPAMVNPEFLACSGIVPADWELMRQPVLTPQVAQLIYSSGVSIVAQGNQIVFIEAMATKAPQDVTAAQIACRYVQTLPHADYEAVGINLRGIVPFAQDSTAARRYLSNTLLAPGAWQEYGQEPMRASLNLGYTLEGRRLYLSVSEAAIQLPEGATSPIVIFSGNFEYRLAEADRQMQLQRCLNNWQADLDTYTDLINSRFLSAPASVSPAGLPSLSLSAAEPLPIGA